MGAPIDFEGIAEGATEAFNCLGDLVFFFDLDFVVFLLFVLLGAVVFTRFGDLVFLFDFDFDFVLLFVLLGAVVFTCFGDLVFLFDFDELDLDAFFFFCLTW